MMWIFIWKNKQLIRNCVENKIKLKRLIIINLYVNHNIKRERGQYFETTKNGKVEKKIMGKGLYSYIYYI